MSNNKSQLIEKLKALQAELITLAKSFTEKVDDFLDDNLLTDIQTTQQEIEELLQNEGNKPLGEEDYKEIARIWLEKNLKIEWTPLGGVNSVFENVEMKLLKRESIEKIVWEVAEKKEFMTIQKLQVDLWLDEYFLQGKHTQGVTNDQILTRLRKEEEFNWLTDTQVLALIIEKNPTAELAQIPSTIPEGETPQLTKFIFKCDGNVFTLDLSEKLLIELPKDWQKVAVEIELTYTPSVAVTVKLGSEHYFNMQIKGSYSYEEFDDLRTDDDKKAQIAKLKISHQVPIKVYTAKTPKQIEADLKKKGDELLYAIKVYQEDKEEFDKSKSVYGVIAAIKGMYSLIQEFDKKAEEAILMTISAESQLIIMDGLPLEHTHMVVIGVNF